MTDRPRLVGAVDAANVRLQPDPACTERRAGIAYKLAHGIRAGLGRGCRPAYANREKMDIPAAAFVAVVPYVQGESALLQRNVHVDGVSGRGRAPRRVSVRDEVVCRAEQEAPRGRADDAVGRQTVLCLKLRYGIC